MLRVSRSLFNLQLAAKGCSLVFVRVFMHERMPVARAFARVHAASELCVRRVSVLARLSCMCTVHHESDSHGRGLRVS